MNTKLDKANLKTNVKDFNSNMVFIQCCKAIIFESSNIRFYLRCALNNVSVKSRFRHSYLRFVTLF